MSIVEVEYKIIRYKPNTSLEQVYKTDFLSLLKEHGKDAFSRDLSHAHFTASIFLYDEAAQKVLLLHHKKLGRWLQPGGHCDKDLNIIRVAQKELEEETGLIVPLPGEIFDLDIHRIPSYKEIPAHFHYDFRFGANIDSHTFTPRSNPESHQVKWLFKEELRSINLDPSIHRMISKVLL